MPVMVQVWSGFLLHLFDDTTDRPLSSSSCLGVGNQGILPADYRDLRLRFRDYEIFVGMFLPLSSAHPHGETIEDKLGLVRKRLEANVVQDTLVVVTFGTFVEVHWWNCRPQARGTNSEASGDNQTRLFKVNLAIDDEKAHLKHYLSTVRHCWETGGDIRPQELLKWTTE